MLPENPLPAAQQNMASRRAPGANRPYQQTGSPQSLFLSQCANLRSPSAPQSDSRLYDTHILLLFPSHRRAHLHSQHSNDGSFSRWPGRFHEIELQSWMRSQEITGSRRTRARFSIDPTNTGVQPLAPPDIWLPKGKHVLQSQTLSCDAPPRTRVGRPLRSDSAKACAGAALKWMKSRIARHRCRGPAFDPKFSHPGLRDPRGRNAKD